MTLDNLSITLKDILCDFCVPDWLLYGTAFDSLYILGKQYSTEASYHK